MNDVQVNGWVNEWIDGWMAIMTYNFQLHFIRKNLLYRISRKVVSIYPLLIVKHCPDFTVLICYENIVFKSLHPTPPQ